MHEVLPKSILTSLTAEDLRLMLCGCPHIDVEVLRGITVFDDESRKSHRSLILLLFLPPFLPLSLPSFSSSPLPLFLSSILSPPLHVSPLPVRSR